MPFLAEGLLDRLLLCLSPPAEGRDESLLRQQRMGAFPSSKLEASSRSAIIPDFSSWSIDFGFLFEKVSAIGKLYLPSQPSAAMKRSAQ